MAWDSSYRLWLTRDVVRYLLTLRATDRTTLDNLFASLVENPFLRGDYQECDEEGHSTELLLIKRFVVTFWSDHAAKEVRVVRIEQV